MSALRTDLNRARKWDFVSGFPWRGSCRSASHASAVTDEVESLSSSYIWIMSARWDTSSVIRRPVHAECHLLLKEKALGRRSVQILPHLSASLTSSPAGGGTAEEAARRLAWTGGGDTSSVIRRAVTRRMPPSPQGEGFRLGSIPNSEFRTPNSPSLVSFADILPRWGRNSGAPEKALGRAHRDVQ